MFEIYGTICFAVVMKRLCNVYYTLQDVNTQRHDEEVGIMGKKRSYNPQLDYEGAWRLEDMDTIDEVESAREAAERFDGMRVFDTQWTDSELCEVAKMCAKYIEDGYSEDKAVAEAAAQFGITVEEVMDMWAEFCVRAEQRSYNQ